MLKRKAMSQLESWKEHKTQQGLLITGARQVGKTTLIREFALQHYQAVVEINFFERPEAIALIKAAKSTDDLLLRVSTISNQEFVPGETLLFFDEIQEFQDILTWAKFLEEQTDFDCIFSGSLLGVDAFDVRSWPVGFLETVQMFPLDFEEFCWAGSVPSAVLEEARTAFTEGRPVADFVHERLMDLYAKYLLIGGMPDAVNAYVELSDLTAVRKAQSAIVELYRHDIAKYMEMRESARFVKSMYDAIPSQLNKENKRFKFSDAIARKGVRYAHLETSFEWLEQAGVALPAFRVSEPVYPLELHDTRAAFKLYLNDIGLLTSLIMGKIDQDVLLGITALNFGSFYENIVAQELKAHGFSLHYYNSTKRGEVDFVIENKVRGAVSLIEVKSGKDYKRHAALANLLEVKDYAFEKVIVLCNGNVHMTNGVTYLPIYMAGFLEA